jgi:predicted site-specific integrase-resolvase
MEDLELLTLKDVGRILNISYATMKRWRRDGILPKPIFRSGRRYWTTAMLIEWQMRPEGSIGIKESHADRKA